MTIIRPLFFTPGECPVLAGKAPRRFSLDAPYYNPLAARADAHQRARILRDAADNAARAGAGRYGPSAIDLQHAAVHQESIGNGETRPPRRHFEIIRAAGPDEHPYPSDYLTWIQA